MTGRDYRAVLRLTDAGGKVIADVGDTCEHVDPASLPWLLDQHAIEAAAGAAATPLPIEPARDDQDDDDDQNHDDDEDD